MCELYSCVLLTQVYSQYNIKAYLTDNMRIALEYRIKGLRYPEIGGVLSRATSIVFEYFIKMRQRYTAIYRPSGVDTLMVKEVCNLKTILL